MRRLDRNAALEDVGGGANRRHRRRVDLRTALWSMPLLAVLDGCSDEDQATAIPAPPATPIVAPVDGAVVQSELRRAVKAMEEHRNAEGSYTRSPTALGEYGSISGEVLIFMPSGHEGRCCIEATSSTDTSLVSLRAARHLRHVKAAARKADRRQRVGPSTRTS